MFTGYHYSVRKSIDKFVKPEISEEIINTLGKYYHYTFQTSTLFFAFFFFSLYIGRINTSFSKLNIINPVTMRIYKFIISQHIVRKVI